MNRRTKITYGQLDKVLRSLGFSRTVFDRDGLGLRYEHQETGALLLLPAFDEKECVYDHHMVAARSMLSNFGVADVSVFESKLQRAG